MSRMRSRVRSALAGASAVAAFVGAGPASAVTPAGGPVLAYSTYFGGDSTDLVGGIAIGPTGDAYLAGTTLSSTLPGGVTRRIRRYDEPPDGFVTRIDPRRGAVLFTRVIGGRESEEATGVAVADDGSVFVVGSTESPDFETTTGDPARGSWDAFIAKLDPEGRPVFVRRWGGSGYDRFGWVRIGPDGVLWVAGDSDSPDLPGPFRGGAGRWFHPFVGRIDPNDGQVLWVRRIGGSSGGNIHGLDVDAYGNAYVAGQTTSWDLPTTVGAAQPFYGGQSSSNLGDAWAAKLDSEGRPVYLTYLGGPGDEYALGVAVDRAGHAHLTGFTFSTRFPTVAARQPSFGGGHDDAWVARLAPDGTAFDYVTYLGGSSTDTGYAVAADPLGDVLLAGAVHSDDFPIVDAFQPQRHVDPSNWESDWTGDAFLTRTDPHGEILSSSYLGGELYEGAGHLAADPFGRTWIAGYTTSDRFPTLRPVQPAYGAGTGRWYDVFLSAVDDPRREIPELHLGGGRFRLELVWFDPYNRRTGVGRPAPLTADTGSFWFFRPENSEVVVKVLDGRPVNGRFWVFYAGMTTVEYWLRVTDTVTGESRTYHNPVYRQASRADTSALPGGGGALPSLSPPAARATGPSVGTLQGGRFELSIDWTDPRTGASGSGVVEPLSSDTAKIWFFRPDNVELLVKLLDGRPVNGKFWVFWGNLTDLEYTLRVRDTETGDERGYHKPGRELRSGSDTAAF